MSAAVVDLGFSPDVTQDDLNRRLSELKKKAKSRPDNFARQVLGSRTGDQPMASTGVCSQNGRVSG